MAGGANTNFFLKGR